MFLFRVLASRGKGEVRLLGMRSILGVVGCLRVVVWEPQDTSAVVDCSELVGRRY